MTAGTGRHSSPVAPQMTSFAFSGPLLAPCAIAYCDFNSVEGNGQVFGVVRRWIGERHFQLGDIFQLRDFEFDIAGGPWCWAKLVRAGGDTFHGYFELLGDSVYYEPRVEWIGG